MRKVIASGMLSSGLEWYEFALYAQFAPIISKQFFPESSISDILTFAVFAAGFIVRPFGGVIFGGIGDKLGRKASLILGIFSMAVPTVCIGLLPSYHTLGMASPIILCLMRLIQGFSLGGVFSGCITYVVEHAPIKNRGLFGSSSFISMCLGMLLGSSTATILSILMSQEDLFNWGWRIPFISGLFMGLVGMYIEKNLSESPLYREAKQEGLLSTRPLMETIRNHWSELLVGVALYATVTAPFFTATVFVETFLHKILHHSISEAFFISTMGLMVMTAVFPISAFISDRIGRKPVLITSCLGITISVYPIFMLFCTGNFYSALWAHVLFAGLVAFYMGPIPTVLVEIFPTKVRLTGVGLSYNISAAVFGGTVPMFGMILIKITCNNCALAFYLCFLCLFTLFVLTMYFKETYRKDLKA